MKLLLLKILMKPLTNLRVLLYLTIVWKITMQIIILLIILRDSLPQRKRLMFCSTLWKTKLVNESSLDENEEESDKQKEEEWSHPCLPSNESNSLNLTLYECYDPMNSFEISLFDEVDAFYTNGLDATMDDAYKDELSIVPYVKHAVIAIAPTPQCDGLHLSYHPKNRVENNTRVLVGHEQHDLCDSYILDVVHDATENYFERGKFGCRNFHATKTPLFMLKVLKLLLFHLPMPVTWCFHDLFSYKFPRHRKWVR